MPDTEHAAHSFKHRHNADGSVDSICLRCFLTAGSARCLPDLKRMEDGHLCKPLWDEHTSSLSEVLQVAANL